MAFGKPFPPLLFSPEIANMIRMNERTAKGQSQSGNRQQATGNRQQATGNRQQAIIHIF
jgi:hypothetical protein